MMATSIQGLPRLKAVWPSPSMVRRRALPRSAVRRSAQTYGVAESWVVPTTRVVGAPGAVSYGPRYGWRARIGFSPYGSSA